MTEILPTLKIITGLALILSGMIGAPSPLNKAPNTAVFVYLTGMILLFM